jgi:hypothetical protein
VGAHIRDTYSKNVNIYQIVPGGAAGAALRVEASMIARAHAFWVHFDGHPSSVTRWADSVRASWVPARKAGM